MNDGKYLAQQHTKISQELHITSNVPTPRDPNGVRFNSKCVVCTPILSPEIRIDRWYLLHLHVLSCSLYRELHLVFVIKALTLIGEAITNA